jgi:hypothetical protein
MLRENDLIGVIAYTARKFACSPTNKLNQGEELRRAGRPRHRERAAARGACGVSRSLGGVLGVGPGGDK